MTSNRPVSEMVERISEVIYDYLGERFPDGALPGGVQIFADDHLDAEFKHEAGCDELAKRILAAIPSAVASDVVERAYREAWHEGYATGDAGGSYRAVENDWLASDSRAALESTGK